MRWSVAVVLLTCAGVVGCGGDDEPKVEIPFGAIIGLSGTHADTSNAESIQLAARHMNAALDARDYKDLAFRFDVQDSQVNTAVAVERSVAAVATGVKGLISDNTLDAAAVAQTYYDADPANDMGVPMICAVCAGPQVMDVADPDQWVYRSTASSTPQGGVLFRLMLSRTPAGNVPGDLNGDGVVKYSMVGSIGFGAGTNAAIANIARGALDPDPTFEVQVRGTNIDLNALSWTTDMQQLVDDQDNTDSGSTPGHVPDAIFAVMQTLYNVPVVKAYEVAGSGVPIFYSSSLRSDQVLDQLGGSGEGSEGISSLTYADSASGQAFADSYQEVLGTSPSSSNAAYYDGAMALMLATLVATRDSDDPASVDGIAVRDAMQQLNDPNGEVVGAGVDSLRRAVDAIRDGRPINYDGANSPMDFDAQGSVRSNVTRFMIDGGQVVEFERYDCISSDACPRIE